MKIESYLAKDEQFKNTTKPHNLPIYPTSSFKLDSINEGMDIFSGKKEGHIYGRYGNPTIEAVAQKIATLEAYGTELKPFGMMVSSGMAAISTLAISQLNEGDILLTQNDLYGGTTSFFNTLLSKMGIEIMRIDFDDLNTLEEVLKEQSKIKMVYCETPANPTMRCIDLKEIANLCKEHGVLTAVDNTFSTPYLQQPLALGFDFVIHSSTKFINGHGNAITGVIVGRESRLHAAVWDTMKLLGTNCNPFDAWLVNNGMKTLALRMDRHSSNALQIAKSLEKIDEVKLVNYPFLDSHKTNEIAKKQMKYGGGMLSFELHGGLEKGIHFMNNVTIPCLAPTLGNIDSLIVHPASMSHSNVDKAVRDANGITDGLIRMSVGIEDVDDLFEDLEQAINKK